MLYVSSLNVAYKDNLVLENISFNYEGNSIFGIVGPNGSGKSTLLKSLLGLKKFKSGSFNWDSSLSSSCIAYVPQKSEYDWDFPLSVQDLVYNSLISIKNFWRFKPLKYQKDVESVLKKFKIFHLKDSAISELSGGQQQRLLLARAFVSNPKVLILDEPFNAIDHLSEIEIMKVLKEFNSQGGTVIMVHHNLNSVHDYFDEILILNNRVVAFGNTKDVFNRESLSEAYGLHFFKDF